MKSVTSEVWLLARPNSFSAFWGVWSPWSAVQFCQSSFSAVSFKFFHSQVVFLLRRSNLCIPPEGHRQLNLYCYRYITEKWVSKNTKQTLPVTDTSMKSSEFLQKGNFQMCFSSLLILNDFLVELTLQYSLQD